MSDSYVVDIIQQSVHKNKLHMNAINWDIINLNNLPVITNHNFGSIFMQSAKIGVC